MTHHCAPLVRLALVLLVLTGAASPSLVAAAVPAVPAETVEEQTSAEQTTATLRSLADAWGIYVGTAVGGARSRILQGVGTDDPVYTQVVGSQYSLVTNANFYWAEVEPRRGVFNFEAADRVTAYAQQHNQTVRCHNLIWKNSLPSYVNASVSNAELAAMAREHVTAIVTHMKGKCQYWDVVNEPFAGNGSLKDTLWKRALGPEYLATVLQWVHSIDPDAILFLNDYGNSFMNAKSQGMYEYYKNATAHHVPLHGIGFESHVHIDTLPDMDSVAANMERFIALGIEIHVTELDVSLNNTLDTIAAGWEAEAKFYGEYLAVCIHHAPGCHSFETWGITDRYSWLGQLERSPVSENAGYMFGPLPWDAYMYDPKPALDAMVATLTNTTGDSEPATARNTLWLPHLDHPLAGSEARARATRLAAHAADVKRDTLATVAQGNDMVTTASLMPRVDGVCSGLDLPPLRHFADSHGIYVGAAAPVEAAILAGVEPIIDPVYPVLSGRHYSLITAADFYWVEVEPQPGVFNFEPAERTLAYAEAHNQTVRCHNLVWYTSLPSYINASVPKATLRQYFTSHITTIMNKFKGRCYAWDVVNEPMELNGTLRHSIWYDAVGPDYIQQALTLAHSIDPHAKLFLNDYLVEAGGAKADGFYNLFETLLAAGVPVHGIGFESHFFQILLPNLATVDTNMGRFLSLGNESWPMELHVTELDVDLGFTLGWAAGRLEKQGKFYRDYFAVCLKHAPGCKSFETWDFPDRYSWLGELEHNPVSKNGGYQVAGLPWDAQYLPKPALFGMYEALGHNVTEMTMGC